MSMLHQLCSHSCYLKAPVNPPNSSTAFLRTINFPFATTSRFNIHDTNYFRLAESWCTKPYSRLQTPFHSQVTFQVTILTQSKKIYLISSQIPVCGGRDNILAVCANIFICFFVGPGAFEACSVECARISLSSKMLFAFSIESCVKIFISLIKDTHIW